MALDNYSGVWEASDMMYCVNCEYPVTRQEVDARKCKNCGKDPATEKNNKPQEERK